MPVDPANTVPSNIDVASSMAYPRAIGWRAMIAAAGFLALFIGGNVLSGILGSGPIPRPTSSDADVYQYFTTNTTAGTFVGCAEVLGAVCLGVFAATIADELRRHARPVGGLRLWAAVAVVAYVASGLLSIALAVWAGRASVTTVVLLRNLSFYAGGVGHVVPLGLFTLQCVRPPMFGRSVRAFGLIAAALAAMSILSVVVYIASVLLPLGRVACMIWAICAAVAMIRGHRRPVDETIGRAALASKRDTP